MKLTIHIRHRLDLTSEGWVSGRQTAGVDEIAELLRREDVDTQVVEAPVGASPNSDFWLVYTDNDELKWHLASIPSDERTEWNRRFLLLDPSRDVAFDLLHEIDAIGAVAFSGSFAWGRPPRTGTVVRRDIAASLGGELGLGLPFFKETQRYASWNATEYQTLAAQVLAYLREAMTAVPGPSKVTAGAAQLAWLDAHTGLLRISSAALVETALTELRADSSVSSRAIVLDRWSLNYPSATAHLLCVIARDETTAVDLAPAVLASILLGRGDGDDILIAAFPRLSGAFREAAADREVVRRCLGISEPILVEQPDPTWLWPSGRTFPDADTVAGVQARLNYLDLGAGPVDGDWTDLTSRAFARWQVLNGLEPTGELDYDAPRHLALMTPEAPE